MNDALNILSGAAAAVLDFLVMALNATCRAMLSNAQASEWVVGAALVLAATMLMATRGRSIGGFALLLLTVVAGAWLAWKTGHTGAALQLLTATMLALHSTFKGRVWTFKKGEMK